jgi:hypothetical protein
LELYYGITIQLIVFSYEPLLLGASIPANIAMSSIFINFLVNPLA